MNPKVLRPAKEGKVTRDIAVAAVKKLTEYAMEDAMCFDCMIAAGYKREAGAHTATLANCVGCNTKKPILSIRHWSK